jgi:hypothetical protein
MDLFSPSAVHLHGTSLKDFITDNFRIFEGKDEFRGVEEAEADRKVWSRFFWCLYCLKKPLDDLIRLCFYILL